MKILINTPDTSLLGGVANHYKGLQPHWHEDVTYNFIAGRKKIPGIVLLPFDLLVFFCKLMFGSYDAVVLNPSLGRTALKRDSLFLLIASLFNVKKLVFLHGWNDELSCEIDSDPRWFKSKYGKADGFFVLAKKFKDKLSSWGISKPIFLMTTKVETRLLTHKVVEKKSQQKTILFLGRAEEYKGIFIAIDAFIILKEIFPDLKLVVAGGGSALAHCKSKVISEGISNVVFLGTIHGREIAEAFTNADLYILPSYSEGMPTSLLEAMAFGLPIISTPVGGIPDFFDTKNMGALVDSKKAKPFAKEMERLLNDPLEMVRISKFNKNYAKRHFMASAVAVDFEEKVKSFL
ncbi:glycosyltransferase family 4 protein [Photobacterium leiognathi]|uniref:glycosyltransferase family 4 protein n=1 Tax=Photobacterium leiognathi TaxID=553611 RepID=UPI0029818B0F|nr:glycosyltransferase [Photobacterium leiognathi]